MNNKVLFNPEMQGKNQRSGSRTDVLHAADVLTNGKTNQALIVE